MRAAQYILLLCLIALVVAVPVSSEKSDKSKSKSKKTDGGAKTDGKAARKRTGNKEKGTLADMMKKRDHHASMFMALIKPIPPVHIKFPISKDDLREFMAAKDALMHWTDAHALFDLRIKKERDHVREQSKKHKYELLDILVKACLHDGFTVQEARMGIVLAHYRTMQDTFRDMGKMAAEARLKTLKDKVIYKMQKHLDRKHLVELTELQIVRKLGEQEMKKYIRKTVWLADKEANDPGSADIKDLVTHLREPENQQK